MKTRGQYDAGMPPGMSETTRIHFDLPSVGKYQRHRKCNTCKRGVHPARNCNCPRCKVLREL